MGSNEWANSNFDLHLCRQDKKTVVTNTAADAIYVSRNGKLLQTLLQHMKYTDSNKIWFAGNGYVRYYN
jgi:hypothetical protein